MMTTKTFLPLTLGLLAIHSVAGAQQPAASAQHSSKAHAEGSAVGELLVTADDHTFDAPSRVPAGRTAVRLVNRGQELHHVQLVRLDDGRTLVDLLETLSGGGPPPVWAHEVGGPNVALPGGGEFTAVMDLLPGTYALLCVIPSPDGTLHVAKGMSRSLTVAAATATDVGTQESRKAGDVGSGGTGSSSAGDVADVTLTLTDYAFGFSKALTPGHHTIRIRTVGSQSHELVIFRLDEGRSAHDVVAWLEQGQQGPPPALPVGGVVGLAPGEPDNLIEVDLERGRYAFICFLPDAKDGRPHFLHGMIQDYEVR